MINLPTFVISQSFYYLMGTIGGLLLTVILLIPAIRRYLIGSFSYASKGVSE